MNYVVLVGRVSNIGDIVSLNSKKYTYITLAVQRTNKNELGIYDTDFIMCETTGNIAEKIKEFVAQIAEDVKVVCSEEYLEECYRNSRKNRGYLFEEMTANLFGGVLDEKPNTSFRDGGDFYINGVAYQAKYMGATYTNETTMHNMGA